MLELHTPTARIRMHFPDISDEENARRMKAVEQAAVRLAIANRRAEAIKEQRAQEARSASPQLAAGQEGEPLWQPPMTPPTSTAVSLSRS